MLLATIVITVMYLGLTFSIAEMSPALPHTGGAYSFARTAMGPWGGFLTGLAENVEYVLTPAVIVYFIGTLHVGDLRHAGPVCSRSGGSRSTRSSCGSTSSGVELSFRVTVVVTLLGAGLPGRLLGQRDRRTSTSRSWAMNVGPGGAELPDGNGPFLPLGLTGVLAACRSRSGSSSRSSSCRWRPRSRSTRSATCRRASSRACSR